MEVTGNEYFIISNTAPDKVAINFTINIKRMWKTCILFEVEELNEFNQDSFFYTYVKNEEMDSFFEKNAYILNNKEEGAFALSSTSYDKITIDSTSRFIDFYDSENIEGNIPYNIHLANVFLYCLILPSDIEHKFCKRIIHLLNEAL